MSLQLLQTKTLALIFNIIDNIPQMDRSKRRQFGFTIVELLVVIVVIGILAVVLFVAYIGISDKANISTVQSDLKNAATHLETYKNFNDDKYSASLADAEIKTDSASFKESIYNQTGNNYCLQASMGKFVYHVSSSEKNPVYGKCPGYSFTMSFDSTNGNYISSIIRTSDGGFAVTGGTNGVTSDAFIAKYNSSGVQSWKHTYSGTGKGNDWGRSIIRTSDNGYMVAGETFNGTDYDIFIAKYDSSGTLIGAIPMSVPDDQFCYSIIQTSEGGYALTGKAKTSGYFETLIAKLDVNGSITWSHSLDLTYNNYGSSIIQTTTPDHSYIIAGSVDGGEQYRHQYMIVKYDSSGNQTWTKYYGGGGNDYGEFVAQITNGYVLVGTTDSYQTGNSDIFAMTFDSSGNETNHFTSGNQHNDWPTAVISTSDGGFAVTGVYSGFNTDPNAEAFIAKGDSSGDMTWEDAFGDANNDYGFTITQNGDTTLTVLGETNSYGGDGKYHAFHMTYDTSDNFISSGLY